MHTTLNAVFARKAKNLAGNGKLSKTSCVWYSMRIIWMHLFGGKDFICQFLKKPTLLSRHALNNGLTDHCVYSKAKARLIPDEFKAYGCDLPYTDISEIEMVFADLWAKFDDDDKATFKQIRELLSCKRPELYRGNAASLDDCFTLISSVASTVDECSKQSLTLVI